TTLVPRPCAPRRSSVLAGNLDVGIVAENLAGNVNPFRNAEKGLLGNTMRHTDHDLVKDGRCASDQVFMTTGERIKRAGINGNNRSEEHTSELQSREKLV